MKYRVEEMTAEEIFCAEAGITTQAEYDAYMDAMYEEWAASQPEDESYAPTDEELEEMYQEFLVDAYSSRIDAVDYGKYDVAGWDIYDY